MYDFIDRKVATLDEGGRFLVWAMRNWVFAIAERRCPISVLGPVFMKRGIEAALHRFHMGMMILNREALLTLHFAPLQCSIVSEDEALLLHLFGSVRGDMGGPAGETLALLVEQGSVSSMHRALAGTAVTLAEAGLIPTPPAPLSRIERNAD